MIATTIMVVRVLELEVVQTRSDKVVQCHHLSNKEEDKTTISTSQREKIPSYLFSFGVPSLMSADRRARANEHMSYVRTHCSRTIVQPPVQVVDSIQPVYYFL